MNQTERKLKLKYENRNKKKERKLKEIIEARTENDRGKRMFTKKENRN